LPKILRGAAGELDRENGEERNPIHFLYVQDIHNHSCFEGLRHTMDLWEKFTSREGRQTMKFIFQYWSISLFQWILIQLTNSQSWFGSVALVHGIWYRGSYAVARYKSTSFVGTISDP
jgi:hypothetical protein